MKWGNGIRERVLCFGARFCYAVYTGFAGDWEQFDTRKKLLSVEFMRLESNNQETMKLLNVVFENRNKKKKNVRWEEDVGSDVNGNWVRIRPLDDTAGIVDQSVSSNCFIKVFHQVAPHIGFPSKSSNE